MSALIKAGSTRSVAAGHVHLNLRDIARQAEAHLSDARAQGARVVREAVTEAERQRAALIEAARRDGYAAGIEQGRAEGAAAAMKDAQAQFAEAQASLIAAMTAAVEGLSSQREAFMVSFRRDVLLVAVAIARKVVSKFVEDDPAGIAVATEAAADAINLVRAATDIELCVNPADAAALEVFALDLMNRLRDGRHIRIVEDADLARGGARVRTADTTIDGAIASRIDRIADALVDGWRERAQELSLGA